MTLVLELDLDILKLYMHSKNELLGQGFQQLYIITDRQIVRDASKCITTQHSRVLKMHKILKTPCDNSHTPQIPWLDFGATAWQNRTGKGNKIGIFPK